MTARTIIDVHALQTVPPSNINRDDTGSPKTAVYGGTRRARVSSQAWKRATRTAFEDLIAKEDLGIRTKKAIALVQEEIIRLDSGLEQTAEALAEGVFTAAGIGVVKAKGGTGEAKGSETGYLLFLSRHQITNLAQLAIDSEHQGIKPSKSDARKAADTNHSVDLVLFGRMVADAPDLNVDAAAQVAHAISVHAVDNEFDYFTAIDDKAPEDSSGAGMIGTVEFNSSTLYRYATVNVDELHRGLGEGDATAAAVSAFLRAFITSMPTGKQNTFANRTLPEAVIVSVRDRQSVNLAGAFEEAIVASSTKGRLQQASERLAEYSREIESNYSQPAVATWVIRVGPNTAALSSLGDAVSLDDLIDHASTLVAERVQAAE